MLVQFKVRNVLSFKDEAVLDMRAVNSYKEHQDNLIPVKNGESLLKVVSIYGANASGKSNLFFAMKYFQSIIIESLNNVAKNEDYAIKEHYYPFGLDNSLENSEFELVFIFDEFEYTYGFEYNEKYIVEEWLYRKNLQTKRTSMILERTRELAKFGSKVKKECDLYKKQIPEESLVLSFFNKLNLETDVFRTVFDGIMNILLFPTDFCEDVESLENFLPKVIDFAKPKLLQFLNAIDSGIENIEYLKGEKENDIKFVTYHRAEDGEFYPLNLYAESEGTLKSIMLFMYASAMIFSNSVIFVDELNTKLHPLVLKFFIDFFYEADSKAQLIYTTHDTTLMDKKFFRRDQICFVQKDEFGHSKLYAMSDFKVRSDASFEKDYLAGVYGGIPFLKEFSLQEEK